MTFEEECEELKKWIWKEQDKILKIPWSGGLDGEGSSKSAALGREVTRRYEELKKKYNIED